MCVVEVLHCFRAKIDTELLQLAWFAVLKPEHVEDANEAISGMPDSVVQDCHGLARLLGPSSANS